MYEIKSNPLSLYTVSPLIGARPRRLIWSTRWGGDQEGGSGKQQQHLVPWQRQKSHDLGGQHFVHLIKPYPSYITSN